MTEQTFTLTQSFKDKIFERFLAALENLKANAEVSNVPEIAEPYTKVTGDGLIEFIEPAFWASLTAEEGRYHPFRLSLGPPREYSSDYVFSEPKPYSASEVSDLAAVLSSNYKSLGVWYSSDGSLEIWGIVDVTINDFEISANSPGQLLFSMLGGSNVAITGSWWGVVDASKANIDGTQLNGMNLLDLIEHSREKFLQGIMRSKHYESIAKSMLRHQHGGTLVIVPENSTASWRESVASIRYEGNVFEEVREDVDKWDEELGKQVKSRKWPLRDGNTHHIRERAMQALEFVAQLTAVDGATIISQHLTVHGFGAKLKPRDSNDRPEIAFRSRPFEGDNFEPVKVSELGGTRHQSAAQFVYDRRDTIVIVCSQDGRISSLSWDIVNNRLQVITNLEYAL